MVCINMQGNRDYVLRKAIQASEIAVVRVLAADKRFDPNVVVKHLRTSALTIAVERDDVALVSRILQCDNLRKDVINAAGSCLKVKFGEMLMCAQVTPFHDAVH